MMEERLHVAVSGDLVDFLPFCFDLFAKFIALCCLFAFRVLCFFPVRVRLLFTLVCLFCSTD